MKMYNHAFQEIIQKEGVDSIKTKTTDKKRFTMPHTNTSYILGEGIANHDMHSYFQNRKVANMYV